MATLAECFKELQARRARLYEARSYGWRDVIHAEAETVSEFESVFQKMLTGRMDEIIELAGEVDLGELPTGVSLAFSEEY